MGRIRFSAGNLLATVTEIVGFKAGLALDLPELTSKIPDEYTELWATAQEREIVLHSSEFEALIVEVLYRLGNVATPSTAMSSIALFHKYKCDSDAKEIFLDLLEKWTTYLENALSGTTERNQSIDPTPFVSAARSDHGLLGVKIAVELCKSIHDDLHKDPLSTFRQVEWSDVRELSDLFGSEDLESQHGKFIDQRFIDYLAANFNDADRMHWRQFEGLTCEFFRQQGFHVEIGPGRNDDNIDARVWPSEANASGPPLIIIQCKRTQNHVGKVVVKALWADVQHEGAETGLVVTTSSLGEGAKKVCTARGYRIGEADRQAVESWLLALRSPGTGTGTDL